MFEKFTIPNSETRKEMFLTEAFTIDPKTVDKLKNFIAGDSVFQEDIARVDKELEDWRDRWVRRTEEEWVNKKRIPVVEFLRKGRIVERNATHQKEVWDKKWKESVRWSNDVEKQFLATATNIGQGKFVEVLQISLVKGGHVTNSDAAVGTGLEVTKESIDVVINNLGVDSAAPDTVYVVHNHFDEYAKLMIPEDEESEDGFATVGGLSKSDIEFADALWSETLKKKTKVFMVAINERGLTFTYEAGTSVFRDWNKADNEGVDKLGTNGEYDIDKDFLGGAVISHDGTILDGEGKKIEKDT